MKICHTSHLDDMLLGLSVKYDKHQQPCLHGLITGDARQQSYCPVTIYTKIPPPCKIVVPTVNRYIETSDTFYHYSCPHADPVVCRLATGNYTIDVEPHCVFDTSFWNSHGLPVLQFCRNITIDPPKFIDLSWLDLTQFPIKKHQAVHLLNKALFCVLSNYLAVGQLIPTCKVITTTD